MEAEKDKDLIPTTGTPSILTRIADILYGSIDDITAQWVEDLRRSGEAPVHNELMSSEMIDGMRAMLANISGTIRSGIAIDEQNHDDAVAATEQLLPTPAPKVERRGAERHQSDEGVHIEVGNPLESALNHASTLGGVRHMQGLDIHEVVREYTHLRRQLWRNLRDNMRETDRPAIEVAMYIDRIMDELLQTTVESYHKHAVQDLERRAIRDPLTALYNHDYFVERLREEIRRAMRHDRPLTLMMIDMDKLKAVNDSYGHQAGDMILRYLARAMSMVGRESDLRCRYAGDEFMIIMPSTTKEEALVAAERLRNEMNKPTTIERLISYGGDGAVAGNETIQVSISPSVSIGIASYPEDAQTPELLIAHVDAALYRAKDGGRNRISI